MEQIPNAQRAPAPGTATDEPVPSPNPGVDGAADDSTESPVAEPEAAPADPRFATRRAEEIYWAGVRHGIRSAGREPGHPHMPADFNLNLTRSSGNPSLVSDKMVEAWPYAPDEKALGLAHLHGEEEDEPPADADSPAPAPARAVRHDGWTDDKVRIFITTLSETGVVADACRAAGMSRDAAYAFRRRASGRAFALAWDAAILIARSAIQDDAVGRARYGVVERVYRNGELVAERHRYDNRLTMAVLARLDRQAEGLGENAPVVRAVAQEFDRFLDLLPQGVRGADAFVEARFPPPLEKGAAEEPAEPPSASGERHPPGSEGALLARLGFYEEFGVGLPAEMDMSDLDPEDMERWTDEQWERAEIGGFLDLLRKEEWPEAARNREADGTNGMCKLRKLYLAQYPSEMAPPPPPPEPEDDFEGCSVWEEEDGWRTDFPPPDGFDGYEEGEPGEDDYCRELTGAELAAVGEDDESRAAEDAERLARQHAARDRFFFFSGEGEGAKPARPATADDAGDGG
jgi:hypothetical protein